MARTKNTITVSFRVDGHRYYVTGKTKKEAEQKAALKKQAIENGTLRVDSNMLVRDWVDKCYTDYKAHLGEETYKKDYAKAKRWISETIGDMPLKKVKNGDIQRVLNTMDGYADYTIKRVRQLFNWVFEKAVENDLLAKNPVVGTQRLKGGKTQRRAITDYEREHLIAVADKVPKLRFFLFMLYCGCRPAEVAEIQGRDIQFVDGVPMLHIRGTKTENADRMVTIPQPLFDRLPPYKKGFDYLFATSSGRKLDPQARKRLWHLCKREMNISMGCKMFRNEIVPPYRVAPDLTPYCFRHTFCTDLAKAGVDMRTAKDLMGHSDIRLTANIYTHIDKSMIMNAGDILNAYYALQQKEPQKSHLRVV